MPLCQCRVREVLWYSGPLLPVSARTESTSPAPPICLQPHIVVATPGRLLDLVQDGTLQLGGWGNIHSAFLYPACSAHGQPAFCSCTPHVCMPNLQSQTHEDTNEFAFTVSEHTIMLINPYLRGLQSAFIRASARAVMFALAGLPVRCCPTCTSLGWWASLCVLHIRTQSLTCEETLFHVHIF